MPDPKPASDKRTDRLETLKAKKAALEAQIAALNAVTTKEKRRQDNHRKILAGAAVLEEAARDPKVAAWLRGQLDRFLKNARDRAVFDLPPLPVAAAANDAGANDAKNI